MILMQFLFHLSFAFRRSFKCGILLFQNPSEIEGFEESPLKNIPEENEISSSTPESAGATYNWTN